MDDRSQAKMPGKSAEPELKMVLDTIIVNRKTLVKRKSRSFGYTFGAALCVASGTISMIAALLLILLSAVTGEGFNGAEISLIVASFVLLSIGAHCLDLIEKNRKLQRREELDFRSLNSKTRL